LLESQDNSRITELVPIRYRRMLASPFALFRGAALIMASDLAGHEHTGPNVQLCGDAHLSNFGLFASPERSLLFDINDFDETLPGPWEWDVLLADYGRSCGHVLARAHARTGDRIAIAGYLGKSDEADAAFTRFAEAYAEQNDRDYAALREAKPGV
jgi:uncharacterized protein (DUF2252 family)